MSLIALQCPACTNAVEIPPAAVLVDVFGPDEPDEQLAGAARWVCVGCADLMAVSVSWSTLLTLVTTGAHLVDPEGDEPVDPRPVHPGLASTAAPLAYDDLLDLHQQLSDDDWFSDLLVGWTRSGETSA